jgi:O-antigen ligase
MTWGRRAAIADGLIAVAAVAVPLVSSSAFVDQYTTVKWYVLHATAAVWLMVEVWIQGSARWPAFVREQRVAFASLAALAVWSTFRAGAAQAVSPLADRTACAVLVLCAAWAFQRRPAAVRALVAGLALSVAATIALGLAQAGGVALPPALAAREGPAALFGNVNIAAQFVGLALVLVIAAPLDMRRPSAWNAFRAVLAVGGALYLYILASRSVVVALAACVVVLASRGRRRLALIGAAVAIAALLVWHPWPRRDPAVAAHKAASVELRLALWADTTALVRDWPLGVGVGNFEDAFLPYQASGRLEPQEALVFRNPHDEYLRYLAEDGLPFVAVAVALLAMLVRRWRASPARSPLLAVMVAGWGTFLAVEAVFQFPLALAFGALAAALTAGAALASVDPEDALLRRSATWRLGGTVVGLMLLAASARIAWSEVLYVRGPDDLGSQRRACALDARNLPACVTAAWLEVRDGDPVAATARLDAVLAGAPHYPPALKLLGEIAHMQGNAAEACRRLGAYDALFRGRSSVHGAAVEACAR